MFALLDEEPQAPKVAKAPAAQSAPKTQAKPLVGGAKRGDVSTKRDSPVNSPQPTSSQALPGEARKNTQRGPRKHHQPRVDQNGEIRGREFERHSGTGRPANENKRSGGGRANWGNPKQAKADSDAAIEAAAAEQVTAVEGEVVENVDATKTEEAPKEPEVKTQTLEAFRAEQAKKQKELNAKLGLAAPTEVRKVQPAWYKPEEKTSTKAAAPAKNAKAAEKPAGKRVVPVTDVLRVEIPRQEREERRFRDERGPRQRREPRKATKTFDATANQEQNFPVLGK